MEFIEKLYSQEYFAPVLFAVVAILAILFIIVLILAVKDSKKKKNVTSNEVSDTFAKVDDVPQEINVNVTSENQEKIEVSEIKEENPVNNIETNGTEFESVVVPAPIGEENETIINNDNNIISEEVTHIPVEPEEIRVEASPEMESSIKNDEVEQAENDLDSIAASLLSEYKKDNKTEDETPVELPQVEETSKPIVEEEKKEIELQNLNDIPVPQPIKVTDTAAIIDSSKKRVDDIQTEEYSLNK